MDSRTGILPHLKFANDGGALIALDLAAATGWRGGVDPEDESDYGRACTAGYPAGRVDVGETWGAIIGADEGIATAEWWREPDSPTYFLIGSAFGDETTDRALRAALRAGTVANWTELGVMRVASGRLVLMHAACAGGDVDLDPPRDLALIGDAVTQAVAPGSYQVAAIEVTMEQEALYNVIRWTPKPEPG